jgi:serine phosphatase RsbU (regulator of sigma subunit)
MKQLLLFLFCLSFGLASAQQRQLDSLQGLLAKVKNDSVKLQLYQNMCELCKVEDNLKYANMALQFVADLEKKGTSLPKAKLIKSKAAFMNILFVYYEEKNDFPKLLEIRQKMIPLYLEIKDTLLLESTYSDIIDLYMEQGKTNQAFELANERLNLYEKDHVLGQIAFYQSKLASLYDRLNYYDKMVEYCEKSLSTRIQMKDEAGIADAHAALAQAYYYNDKNEKAIEHSLQSLQYFEKKKNKEKVFNAYVETSMIYASLKDFDKALEYSDKAYQMARVQKDSSMVSHVLFGRAGIFGAKKDYVNAVACRIRWYNISVAAKNEFNTMNAALSISNYYFELDQRENAFKFIRIADSIAKKRKDLYAARRLYELKFELYRKKGQYEIALENRLLYDKLNDSISAIENHEGLEKKEMLLDFEKNELRMKEEQFIKDQKAEAEKNRQKTITLFVGLGLLVVLVMLLLIYRNYRLKQKSNIELSLRNAEISTQKHLIEEKQKEITESITYAKRLQEAILPPNAFVTAHVPDNFIYYQPKDIVAGDFYWAEKVNDLFFIAAADSTGHGVPGAMVSVVCSNALNRTIKEFKLSETGKILDKTRELVLETFEKSDKEVKDGMDISLLCIDGRNKKIFWSGANNPLWYVQDKELKEIKADKQAIGKTDYPKPFTTHSIEYQENTTFYLFTDGFADQFGGPNGKKFKYKPFGEVLLNMHSLTMKEQSALLHKTFSTWKGDLEQVDDLCVIGIRI